MFRELYIKQRSLKPEAYHESLLRECLYWHARLLKPVLPYIKGDLLSADLDLIDAVGSLKRRSQFNDCLFEHSHHPLNRGPSRRVFRLRISIKKLHIIFYGLVPPTEGSNPPVTKMKKSTR